MYSYAYPYKNIFNILLNVEQEVALSKNNLYQKLICEIKKIQKDSLISFLNKPNIQILGNDELFAEGIISIYKYTKEEICFSVNYLALEISGTELEMRFYTKTSIKVTGIIDSVSFLNCKKE